MVAEAAPPRGNASGPRRFSWTRGRVAGAALVGLLLACGFHQRFAATTRIVFTVTMDGQPVTDPLAYSATLSGVSVQSGDRAAPGRRRFRVAMPDAAPIERVVWIGYGTHRLGPVALTRTRASLSLDIEPPPPRLELTGLYAHYGLTNSRGLTASVPIGAYAGRALYDHFLHRFVVQVESNGPNRIRIAPPVGRLEVSAAPPDAQFQLRSTSEKGVEVAGTTPARVGPLPAGAYHLRLWRGDYSRQTNLVLQAGSNLVAHLNFEYGQLRFVSTPPGAAILADGHVLGRTPTTLDGYKPGHYAFRLQKAGYFPVDLEADVRGAGRIALSTNLTSYRYAEAMATAHHEAAVPQTNYARALAAVGVALEEKPDDPDALALQRELTPLLAQQQRGFEEQRKAEEAAARRRHPTEVFERFTAHRRDQELFETQTLLFPLPLEQVRQAAVRALAAAPPWQILLNVKPSEATCLIDARSESFVRGKRQLVLVAGQIADTEVEVRFKLWDYVLDPSVTPNPVRGVTDDNYVPLHPDRLPTESAADVALRRRAALDEFRARLEKELQPTTPK